MWLEARYENDKVWLNSDYIVDVFYEKTKVIAYTVDADRSGYEIKLEDWNEFLYICNVEAMAMLQNLQPESAENEGETENNGDD